MTKGDLPPLKAFFPTYMIDTDAARAAIEAYRQAAIAAHDTKREKVLLCRMKASSDFNGSHGFWLQTLGREVCDGYEFAWAYIEREGA